MIIKCPNCAGALEFDPVTGMMMCPWCNSTFETSSFSDGKYVSPSEQESINNQNNDQRMANSGASYTFNDGVASSGASPYSQYESQGLNTEMPDQNVGGGFNSDENIFNNADYETYETNVYKCTSCGAELSVNGVETSTFCAYCGQPTVIFDRVSNQLKPKLIIPFKIPKGKALQNINEKFKKGIFIPKEIKNYELEKMRGIYIPYWLFDLYYYDNLTIKARKGSGKNSRTVTYNREADVTFHRMTLDASKNLNDDSSQRLEPFDVCDLKPFDVGYMTGYYADKYDMDVNSLRSLAISRATELFQKEVLSTCDGTNKRVTSSCPRVEFKMAEYALLPAWFMTFRYENRPYTMLVNGQTGKVVGAVPYNKKKLFAFIAGFTVLLWAPCSYGGAVLAAMLLNLSDVGDMLKILIMIAVAIVAIVGFTYKNFDSVKKSNMLSSEGKINRFVKERQDRV